MANRNALKANKGSAATLTVLVVAALALAISASYLNQNNQLLRITKTKTLHENNFNSLVDELGMVMGDHKGCLANLQGVPLNPNSNKPVSIKIFYPNPGAGLSQTILAAPQGNYGELKISTLDLLPPTLAAPYGGNNFYIFNLQVSAGVGTDVLTQFSMTFPIYIQLAGGFPKTCFTSMYYNKNTQTLEQVLCNWNTNNLIGINANGIQSVIDPNTPPPAGTQYAYNPSTQSCVALP